MKRIDVYKKAIIEHFGIIDLAKISNQKLTDQLMGMLYQMINRKHQLREAIATKVTQNSADINFMYKKALDI